MEQLFDDSELIQKERPTKITEKQEVDYYKSVAEEILKNSWSNSDIEDIIHDLSEIGYRHSGYEIAKKLEDYRARGSYDIDTQFIEFLDDFFYHKDEILTENVKLWAKAHNPKPKLKKGQELIMEKRLNIGNEKIGQTLYVTGIDPTRACYYVHENKDNNGGYIIAYEKVESSCKIKSN